MPSKLTNLQVNDVSLVDRGANPHAKVALFKRDDPADIAKAVATSSEIKASLLRQLTQVSDSMLSEPGWLDDFAAQIHANLEAAKAKQRRDHARSASQLEPPKDPVPTAKAATASVSAEEPEFLRRAKRLANVEPAEPVIAKNERMADRLAKSQVSRPASEEMTTLAKAYRDQRIAAGFTITAEKAYQMTFMDPRNAELASRVREEEQPSHAARRLAKAAPRPASEKMAELARSYFTKRTDAGVTLSTAKAYEAVYLNPENADLARQVRAEELAAARPV